MYDHVSHKEIIDTFFKKTSHQPSKKKHKPGRKKTHVPLFAGAFLLLAFVSILAIIILGRETLQKSGLESYSTAQRVETLIRDGVVERAYIEEARFDADATNKSSFLKSSIRLVNQGSLGRAAFMISFKERLSLKNKSILITARSETGLAAFKLLLQDRKGNFFMAKEVPLAGRWSREHIFIKTRNSTNFDFGNISGLKIEFGSKTVGNRQDAVIYIKNLVIREGE